VTRGAPAVGLAVGCAARGAVATADGVETTLVRVGVAGVVPATVPPVGLADGGSDVAVGTAGVARDSSLVGVGLIRGSVAVADAIVGVALAATDAVTVDGAGASRSERDRSGEVRVGVGRAAAGGVHALNVSAARRTHAIAREAVTPRLRTIPRPPPLTAPVSGDVRER